MKTKIIELAKSLGVSDIGFFKDNEFKAGFSNGISIVVALSKEIVEEIDEKNGPTYSYFHHYRAVNAYIDNVLLRLGMLLQSEGYRYIPIGASQTIPEISKYSGRYSHKKAATLCSLGTIGKNALFIHKEFGSGVRLGTLFTNFELNGENNILPSLCNECNACVTACPAMAISGKSFDINNPSPCLIDQKACSDFMKNKYQHVGRGSVCGICMKVCQNKNNFI